MAHGVGCLEPSEHELPGGQSWHSDCAAKPLPLPNVPASQFCLDYVFLGGGATCVGASFGAGPPPYAAGGDGAELPQLPCAAWPSDHLPVVVELCLGE